MSIAAVLKLLCILISFWQKMLLYDPRTGAGVAKPWALLLWGWCQNWSPRGLALLRGPITWASPRRAELLGLQLWPQAVEPGLELCLRRPASLMPDLKTAIKAGWQPTLGSWPTFWKPLFYRNASIQVRILREKNSEILSSRYYISYEHVTW